MKKTKQGRFGIYMTSEVQAGVEQYMKARGMKSRSKAVTELVEEALSVWELTTFYSERIEADICPTPRENWSERLRRWVHWLDGRCREVTAMCL